MQNNAEVNPNTALQVDQIGEEQIDGILRKFDKESTFRNLTGPLHRLFYVSAVIFTLAQIYFNMFGGPPTQVHRSLFYGFILFFAFLLYPVRKGSDKIAWYDYVLAFTALLIAAYWPLNYDALIMRLGENTPMDVAIGIIAVLLSLECTRRVVGLPLVVMAILFLGYGLFGRYLPVGLMHRGFSVERIAVHMFYTTEGVLGMPLGVMSTYVFMFIVFASFLSSTGIGEFFVDFANSIVGQAKAGPAKVAVITSALLGTLSGSSVANTVGTGSITIPLMKKLGYKPSFAGAVEAAASTGGQLMPPVMGSAAFLMSEIIGLPYVSILIADLTPPVAVAAFAGAGIAGADPIKTAFNATKLAIAAFLIPYIFVYNNSLLLIDVSFVQAVWIFCTSIFGMAAVASSVQGWFLWKTKWYERILGFVGGILLIEGSWQSDVVGIVLVLIALGPQYMKHRNRREEEVDLLPA